VRRGRDDRRHCGRHQRDADQDRLDESLDRIAKYNQLLRIEEDLGILRAIRAQRVLQPALNMRILASCWPSCWSRSSIVVVRQGRWLRAWNSNASWLRSVSPMPACRRNAEAGAEVASLREGNEAIAERARHQLNMVREGEVLFQFIGRPAQDQAIRRAERHVPVAARNTTRRLLESSSYAEAARRAWRAVACRPDRAGKFGSMYLSQVRHTPACASLRSRISIRSVHAMRSRSSAGATRRSPRCATSMMRAAHRGTRC